MCHGFKPRDRTAETDEEEAEPTEADPEFLNDEPAEDVEIVTDGGDE
jgi:hypothetical protein